MAKKKLTHQPQDPNLHNPQDQTLAAHPHPPKMEEDPKEKLQNLKSLNSLLLKETIERRQQVESLVHAKEALEAELSGLGMVNAELETGLTLAADEKVSLEIEKGLFCVFIETLVDDMGVGVDGLVREKVKEIELLRSEVSELMVSVENERERLSRACLERDSLRSALDGWIQEANGLTEKVIEMEKKERMTEEEIGKLKRQYSLIVKEKNEREKQIMELKSLKESAEKSLLERAKEIESLNRDMEEILSENRWFKKENEGQNVKIKELEKEVTKLNEMLSSSHKEEGVLRGELLELERSSGESMEKLKAMTREIDSLMKEKREKEIDFDALVQEKNSIENHIQMASLELDDKTEFIEKILREKKVIEEVKDKKEAEILELQRELGKVKDVVVALQKSIKDQEDNNGKLVLEVSHYRDGFERVELERDDARKGLDEERQKSSSLKSKILEMESQIENLAEELAKLKIEHKNLAIEKKEMECQVESLEKEKGNAQKNLLEAHREISDLRTKTESVAISSERALTMLKNTAALVCQSINGKEEAVPSEKKLDDESEPYLTELEVIKSAFRNRETVVGEMKQQLEFLQNCVAEANKKKSFWTMLSSAITVFAAVSLAYVSRVR